MGMCLGALGRGGVVEDLRLLRLGVQLREMHLLVLLRQWMLLLRKWRVLRRQCQFLVLQRQQLLAVRGLR